MFVNAVKIAKEAMFPIFIWKQENSQVQVGVVGTGFFINSRGCFISVAHIFDNTDSNTKFLFWGQLPEKLQDPPTEIKEIARNDNLDIFVGKIELKTPIYFNLEKNTPEEGHSVCICGYPLAQITKNDTGGLELGGVRRYFQPSFVLDKIKINSDNGQGKIRIHDGFLVRDVGLFGMSGGPVFNIKGNILGIQGSVTQPRISNNASGRSISVENAVVIRSELIIDILKEKKIRFNLWGKI